MKELLYDESLLPVECRIRDERQALEEHSLAIADMIRRRERPEVIYRAKEEYDRRFADWMRLEGVRG